MTPDELQGRVGSALGFVTMGAMPLAPLLGGCLLATSAAPTRSPPWSWHRRSPP